MKLQVPLALTYDELNWVSLLSEQLLREKTEVPYDARE